MSETSDSSSAKDEDEFGRRYKLLVARTFQSEQGAELLAEWDATYLESPTFSADPVDMAARAARKDFVGEIHSIIREVKNWKS